jgi:hypothetical protein
MNRAQRLTLKVVLAIDVLLSLFPPFESHRGWRTFDQGYHLLPYWLLEWGVSIDFGRLAAEIAIVAVIGFTVFILGRDIPDERTDNLLIRLSALVRRAKLIHLRSPATARSYLRSAGHPVACANWLAAVCRRNLYRSNRY